jgi:hypothetical protein
MTTKQYFQQKFKENLPLPVVTIFIKDRGLKHLLEKVALSSPSFDKSLVKSLQLAYYNHINQYFW